MNKENYKKAIDQIYASDELKKKVLESNKKTKKLRMPYMSYLAACAMLVLVVTASIFYAKRPEDILVANNPKVPAKVENDLPRFESVAQIKDVLKENSSSNSYGGWYTDVAINESTLSSSTATKGEADISTDITTYSTTNTQVENVDEADIVKTDGKYIYYVANNKVYIVKADTLEAISIIELEKFTKRVTPEEIFINGKYLIILGNSYEYSYTNNNSYDEEILYDVARTTLNRMAVALVYDISNKEKPKQTREVSLDGYYQNSRMIGDNIYFISQKSMYYYDNMKDDDILPVYLDTVLSKEIIQVSCTDIAYFKNTDSYSYLMVSGFNIKNDESAYIETFFGASDKIYASEDNLYITTIEYTNGYWYNNSSENVIIYKFNLDDSKIKLQCQGKVKGYLNDQFSMDEYDGNLRIATTLGYDDDSKNQLYVLDKDLNEIGKIDNMAPGEKIYSVRFVGKVGYVVTFEQIDPLFVIDLSDPKNPVIKGELKIPGYSSYLHPYDETHVIGIGYNTKSNGYGGVTNDNMKMSMFDVSDLENPKEVFSVDIGTGYVYSDITRNHKILFYNKDENLIGFPITMSGRGYNSYYENGFIIYKIDLENNKFEEYGKNLENDNYFQYVRRIIYIGNTLYALGQNTIVSYDLETIKEIKKLDLQ